jgi:tetratricopeptide (TPR) repeat protein
MKPALLKNCRCGWVMAALAGLVLFSYWPALRCDFVNYDDNKYVTENPHARAGLSMDSVRWAFATGYASNWHPLTWLSHQTDCQLFGLEPLGHHFTNLLLHLTNTLLLFVLLRRMTGSPWPSATVAALFGLHPAHVESVAWVAERKDVLSAFFFMLTLLAYARYIEMSRVQGTEGKFQIPTSNLQKSSKPLAPTSQRAQGTMSNGLGIQSSKFKAQGSRFLPSAFYLAALTCFALGLLAKPMLVTLPFLLLLLDFWPLNRLPASVQGSRFVPLLLEKLPFFVLSTTSSLVTIWAQQHGGSVVSLEEFSFPWRCANALASYARYAGKLLWPQNLAVLYPFTPGWPVELACGGLFALAAFTFLAFKVRRTAPYLLVGWLWFVSTLVPVIGLVQVGEQAMADRYTYLPSIGFFLMVCWTVAQNVNRFSLAKPAAALIALCACSLLTRHQVGFWRDSISLFKHAIAVTENNSTAHATLGSAYDAQNRSEDAIHEYQLALQICPGHVLAHNNYGVALARQGKVNEAIAQYEEALRAAPDNSEAHFNLANALSPSYVAPSGQQPGTGHHTDLDLAADHYRTSLRLDPTRIEAHVNWGNLELGQRRYEQAQVHYEEALRLDPHSWLACFNLGNVFTKMDKTNEALASFSEALRSRPDDAETHLRIGNLVARRGEFERALPHFETATKLQRDNWLAWHNLGGVQSKLGKLDEAARCFSEAARLCPENAEPHASLARLLVLQDKRDPAIQEYSEALRLDPQNAEFHHSLAFLLEQQGRRQEALTQLTAVAELKPQEASAQYDLASAFARVGRGGEAAEHLRTALRLKPDWIPALNNLAWILATDPNPAVRDGTDALRLAKKACELTNYKDARVLGTLDAACAEAGQFNEAIEAARKTSELALAAGHYDLAQTARARLRGYEEGKPFHEPPRAP